MKRKQYNIGFHNGVHLLLLLLLLFCIFSTKKLLNVINNNMLQFHIELYTHRSGNCMMLGMCYLCKQNVNAYKLGIKHST